MVRLFGLGALWVALLVCGARVMLAYEYRPGASAAAPAAWPAASAIARAPDRPVLVLFAHPKCPCTRPSIDELAAIVTRCTGQVDVHVVFVKPAGVAEGWETTDIWESAARIPGVRVQRDDGGREAKRFGAATSGQVLLYDVR